MPSSIIIIQLKHGAKSSSGNHRSSGNIADTINALELLSHTNRCTLGADTAAVKLHATGKGVQMR